MRKVTLSLAALVVTLALHGCIIFPAPGHRTDAGVAPREVYPNITTRAKLLKKGPPDLRTPDERFFLYQNTGSREWKLCWAVFGLNSAAGDCKTRLGTNHWNRWEFIEFDENGVVKKEIVRDCEKNVCGSPQAAFLAVLQERYSPTLASEYRRALEQADALSQAVSDGDVQAIKSLLEAGADANARYANGRTALHQAVAQGNTVLAERLLTGGADANARDDQGRTALHLAVSQGNTVLAERLLTGGADVNAADKNYETPLLLSQDNAEMIALLRAHGAPEVNEEQRRMLREIVGTWHGDGQRNGRSVYVTYVIKANGAFVYDWVHSYASGHVEQPPGTLHANGEKLEYKDAEGLLWTFTLDEDKKGRHILHVQSKEGSWTLEQTQQVASIPRTDSPIEVSKAAAAPALATEYHHTEPAPSGTEPIATQFGPFSLGDTFVYTGFRDRYLGERNGQLVFERRSMFVKQGELVLTLDGNQVKWSSSLYGGVITADPHVGMLKFPMKVGMRWTHSYTLTSETRSMGRTATMKVRAYEQVKTPAGEFWAFKIERLNQRDSKAPAVEVYWFAPEVGRVVKYDFKSGAFKLTGYSKATHPRGLPQQAGSTPRTDAPIDVSKATPTPTPPTTVAKAAPQIQQGAASYTIGIFPFESDSKCIGQVSRPTDEKFAAQLGELIARNESMRLAYSDYDSNLNHPPIKNRGRLWKGSKPNLAQVVTAGEIHGLYAVVMYWRPAAGIGYCTNRMPPFPVDIWVIDVKQQKAHKLNGHEASIDTLAEQALSKFLEGRR